MLSTENMCPFVAVIIVAVGGGVEGRGYNGTVGIFNIRLSEMLRDLCRGIGRFRFVQEFIRDLQVESDIDGATRTSGGETHRQSHDIRHQGRKHRYGEHGP